MVQMDTSVSCHLV